MKNTYYGYSDIGQCRKNNEDAFLFQYLCNKQNLLIIVADGIGGNESGEIGSYITCKCVCKFKLEVQLRVTQKSSFIRMNL